MTVADEEVPLISHRAPPAAWMQRSTEPPLDPGLPIVDAHHHFSPHWGGYGVEELRADIDGGHRVVATVHIQCANRYRTEGPEALRPVGETAFVVELAKSAGADAGRIAAGIVGYADLRLGDAVDAVLAAHVEAGEGRFRGIRNSGSRHAAFKHGVLPRPPAGLYGDPAFRRGYARLAKYGLSFDAWVYHPQLDEVLDLARAFPHIPMVLDHYGGLLGVGPYADGRERLQREWLPLVKALAACPNITMKLGGMGTATFGPWCSHDEAPPSSQALAALWRPYVLPCLDAFGAERCLFESNFPVDRSNGGYGVLWNAFKRLTADASASERARLFHGTAQRVYRLALPGVA